MNEEITTAVETTETTEATEATAPAESKKFGIAEYGILVAAGYGAYCAVTDGSKAIAKAIKKFKAKRAAKKAAETAPAPAAEKKDHAAEEKAG